MGLHYRRRWACKLSFQQHLSQIIRGLNWKYTFVKEKVVLLSFLQQSIQRELNQVLFQRKFILSQLSSYQHIFQYLQIQANQLLWKEDCFLMLLNDTTLHLLSVKLLNLFLYLLLQLCIWMGHETEPPCGN